MCLLIPVDLELWGWGDTVGNGRWEERKRLGIIPPLAPAPGTSEDSSGPGPLLLQLSPAQVGLCPVARGVQSPPHQVSQRSPHCHPLLPSWSSVPWLHSYLPGCSLLCPPRMAGCVEVCSQPPFWGSLSTPGLSDLPSSPMTSLPVKNQSGSAQCPVDP